jgi:HSP20 family protein
MPDQSGRPSRGSGAFTVYLADELEVYFNEVAHGKPVGFASTPKWKPPTDVFETDDAVVIVMDIAGMTPTDFQIEHADGVLSIRGERKEHRREKRHYHGMEVQMGPFERRLRLPAPVDPESVRAIYADGILEVRLTKVEQRPSTPRQVRVE